MTSPRRAPEPSVSVTATIPEALRLVAHVMAWRSKRALQHPRLGDGLRLMLYHGARVLAGDIISTDGHQFSGPTYSCARCREVSGAPWCFSCKHPIEAATSYDTPIEEDTKP